MVNQWDSVIQGFEEYDRGHPPAPGAVLLTGSSSIGLWPDPRADLAPLRVIQRGFGGSCMFELLHYTDRVILPYRPAQIVIYSGDNDIAGGRTPAQVAADFAAILARVREKLGKCPLYCLSVKPSPSRMNMWPAMRETNALLRACCESARRTVFVDVATPMLNAAGTARTELFSDDMLHMNAKGYALWAAILKPMLLARPASRLSDLPVAACLNRLTTAC